MELLKKHKILVIVAGVLILIAAALLIYRFAILKSPEAVLKQYMACIERQEYDSMYEMLDEESRNQVSKKEFVTRNQNIYEGIGAKNITIRVFKEKEGAVSYRTSLDSSAGEIRFPNEMNIHKEDGRYRIAWTDGLIFPQLGSEDTVKVVTLEAERGKYLRSERKAFGRKGIRGFGRFDSRKNERRSFRGSEKNGGASGYVGFRY